MTVSKTKGCVKKWNFLYLCHLRITVVLGRGRREVKWRHTHLYAGADQPVRSVGKLKHLVRT